MSKKFIEVNGVYIRKKLIGIVSAVYKDNAQWGFNIRNNKGKTIAILSLESKEVVANIHHQVLVDLGILKIYPDFEEVSD